MLPPASYGKLDATSILCFRTDSSKKYEPWLRGYNRDEKCWSTSWSYGAVTTPTVHLYTLSGRSVPLRIEDYASKARTMASSAARIPGAVRLGTAFPASYEPNSPSDHDLDQRRAMSVAAAVYDNEYEVVQAEYRTLKPVDRPQRTLEKLLYEFINRRLLSPALQRKKN